MTLVSKLSKASLAVVGKIQTDKRNEHQKYDYISADAVLMFAGKAIAEQGIVVWPSTTAEATESIEYTDNYGKAKSRYDSVVEFAFMVSDGEQTMTLPWVGRGSDSVAPDKALYKAMTSGHKYFLMKLLNIGVGNEDGEHEVPQDEDAKTQPKQIQRKPAPPAPSANGNGKAAEAATEDNPFEEPQPRGDIKSGTLKRLHAVGTQLYGSDAWDDKRHELVSAATKGAATSASDLMETEARTLIAGMEAKLAKMQQPDADLTK